MPIWKQRKSTTVTFNYTETKIFEKREEISKMRGLNKLYYLKIDIENIKEEIRSLPTISSPQITGMPHGTGVSNPIEQYFIKKAATFRSGFFISSRNP